MKHVITASLLILTASAGMGVRAGSLDNAINAARQGDYETALRLLEPLATQGDAIAEFALGNLYDTGHGGIMDSAKAALWYRRAADQGFPEAENNLGALYSNGEGVPHDHAEAVRWWRLAADQGLPTAQANLADLLAAGDGVPRDLVQAFKWSALAATQGDPRGSDILKRVSMQMTPEQIMEAQRLVEVWSPASAQHI